MLLHRVPTATRNGYPGGTPNGYPQRVLVLGFTGCGRCVSACVRVEVVKGLIVHLLWLERLEVVALLNGLASEVLVLLNHLMMWGGVGWGDEAMRWRGVSDLFTFGHHRD